MSIKRAAAVFALAMAAVLLALSALHMPDMAQYAFSPPEPVKADGAAESDEGAEGEKPKEKKEERSPWDKLLLRVETMLADEAGLQNGRLVRAYKEGESLQAGGASATARVIGVWGDLHLMEEELLLAGRRLYPEEAETGAAVAVVDESLAVELFRTGAPIDREMSIGGKSYRVVGVIRHHRRAGDRYANRVTVPLRALDRSGLKMDAAEISFRTLPGAGAFSRVGDLARRMMEGGTVYSLKKEKARALLPARYLLCSLGVMALSLTLPVLKAASKAAVRRGKGELKDNYFYRLMPRWAARALLMALLWAAWGAGAYAVLAGAVRPVYVFPEWVPSVPVEWRDIAKSFWENRETVTGLVRLYTPEVHQLSFLLRMETLCCALLFGLLIKPCGMLKEKIKQKLR